MNNTAVEKSIDSQESQIAALLEARFGDRLMYPRKNNSYGLLNRAIQLGFLDDDGYLTRKGRSLLTRHHFNY